MFTSQPAFHVSILGPEHQEPSARFATKGADKFAGDEFRATADGLPALPDVLVSLRCRPAQLVEGGGHTILIARVEDARARPGGQLLVHTDRRYWDLVPREVGER